VDEPNTLLVFTKRAKVERSRVVEVPDEVEGEANIDDSPQQNFSPSQVDERPEHNKPDINQQSIYYVTPNYQLNELIVDFQLIERPSDLCLIFVTHSNNIYFKNLNSNT
jgi:hypothetical protein